MLCHPINTPKPNRIIDTIIMRTWKYLCDDNFLYRVNRAKPSPIKIIPTTVPKTALSMILVLNVLVR